MPSQASAEVHNDLLAGRPVRFSPSPHDEDEEGAARRTIPAKWIDELLVEHDRICSVPIFIENAIIDGEIEKPFSEFKYWVEFVSCDFRHNLTLWGSVFRRRCSFRDSRFRGDLLLSGISVPFSLDLRGSKVDGLLALDDATVGTVLRASGAEFHTVGMERVRARAILFRTRRVGDRLQPTIFRGTLRLLDSVVEASIELDGVQFHGEVNFTRVKIGANLFVRVATVDDDLGAIDHDPPTPLFAQSASFREMRVEGSVEFIGVEFRGEVAFDAATIGADLNFGAFKLYPNVFHGQFLMRRAVVAGRTIFSASHFIGKTDFRLSELAGGCYFNAGPDKDRPPIFDDDVDFRLVRIGGNLEFVAGTFGGIADFHGTRVAGDFWIFEAPRGRTAYFRKNVECNGLTVEGSLDWRCPTFEREVNFANLSVAKVFALWPSSADVERTPRFSGPRPVRFNGARIGSELNLSGTSFEGGVNFYGLRCELVILSRSNVSQYLNLFDATVSTLRLGERDTNGDLLERTKLPMKIDLRGARFERLTADVIDLANRQYPYDRSVFEALEIHLRKTGDDREAGKVYYLRKQRESQALRGRVFTRKTRRTFRERIAQVPAVIADLFARWVYRYGVRPLRLLALSIIMVLVGTTVFSRPGATDSKEKGAPSVQLRFLRAFGYSLRLFVPIVDLPVADNLRPSQGVLVSVQKLDITFEGYAVAHRLAGAILVPLGVAALAGALVRKPKS